MEGSKGVGLSSSSLAWELFGSKDPPSYSSGIFGSIFAPPSKDSAITLPSIRRMVEKRIQGLHQQETGGKDLSITRVCFPIRILSIKCSSVSNRWSGGSCTT
ncbi:hypothetical protein V6N13_013808 [Hibiscus sabdariffa]